MFRAWYKFFIFVKETRKEAYPAPPFCAPGLSASWVRKTGRFGTLPSAPKFPRGKELRAGSRIVIFLIFASFGSRKIGYQRPEKTAKRQFTPRTPKTTPHTCSKHTTGEHGGTARLGGGGGATRGRVRTHHAPRFQALTLFAEYPVQAGVRCGGGEADRFRCAPGLARVCAGGHAVRAAWTLRHGLLMRAGLTVLSANTCGAGHLLTRHLLKRLPIVRRVRLGGAESACSFPRLPTPA